MNPSTLLLAADPSPFGGMIFPIVAVAGVFYFFVYRPNQKDEAARKELIAGLQRGDKVVTSSGIHGKMHEAKGETIVMEVSPGCFLTVDREAVKAKIVEPPAEPAKKD
ncbi:hypothetical protein LBMAG42_38810 [Deltaproteobacteria bacterium]|nr:hypothetical protein LBMAG42_38810 [Deltaproteobacteria bacterium]